MRNLLIVFSNPVDGRVEDFNDWYTNVHIRDVMRMPSAIAVQRFCLAEKQPVGAPACAFQYLAIYEVDETLKITAAHGVAMTPKLPVSTAFDLASPAHYFRLRSFVTADPLAVEDGDVILALFDDGADFDAVAAVGAVSENGIVSVAHLEVLGDQLILAPPDHEHAVLLRVADGGGGGVLGAVVRNPAVVARYSPLTPRLTSDAVLNADARDREIEDRARAALGDRQHRLMFRDGVAVPQQG